MNTFGRKSVNILGCRVDSARIPEVLEFFDSRLKNRGKFYVVTPNPEIVLRAERDSNLRKIINESDLALADGVGLNFASIMLGMGRIEITKGREVFYELIKLAAKRSYKVFLFGGRGGVAEELAGKLAKRFERLEILGKSGIKVNENGEPDTKRDVELLKKTIDSIKNFNPHIIFVGLGCPKQEKFVAKWINRLPPAGWMVVGGAFDYYLGNTRVPKIIGTLSLEWLWRLIIEPKRIGRIFSAVLIFPFRVLSSKTRYLYRSPSKY